MEAQRIGKELKRPVDSDYLLKLSTGELSTDDKKLASFVKDLRVLIEENIWLYTCPDLDMTVPAAVAHLAPKFEYGDLEAEILKELPLFPLTDCPGCGQTLIVVPHNDDLIGVQVGQTFYSNVNCLCRERPFQMELRKNETHFELISCPPPAPDWIKELYARTDLTWIEKENLLTECRAARRSPDDDPQTERDYSQEELDIFQLGWEQSFIDSVVKSQKQAIKPVQANLF